MTALAPHYDALCLSYGASRDRTLSIPGESTLHGIYSARAFVGWYNGLPEYSSLSPDLSASTVVVIGQGNVALDVARILLSPLEALKKTDITAHAVETLAQSKVKNVRIVGRRGPLQAAFTVKEVRELLTLPGVGFAGMAEFESLLPPEAERKKLPRLHRRIVEVLSKGSATPLEQAEKSWSLEFLRAPTMFLPNGDESSRLGGIRFEKTDLQDPQFEREARAISTGNFEDMAAGLAFRSIGYLSQPLAGFEELGIPFNHARGLVPNEDGRVVVPLPGEGADADGSADAGSLMSRSVPGVYAAGWVKRGPTGVIASTMYDAFDTADAIVGDWETGVRGFLQHGTAEKRGWTAVQQDAENRGIRRVSWDEWRKIDEAEKERGHRVGKEREKFPSEKEMLSVLGL